MESNDNDSEISLSRTQQIKIIDMLIQDLTQNCQPTLDFVIDFQPLHTLQQLSQNNRYEDIHTYIIPGSKILRRTQNSNLLEKISKIQKDEDNMVYTMKEQDEKVVKYEEKQKEKEKEEEEEGDMDDSVGNQDLEKKSQEEIELENNQQYRYYKNDNVICHKCKKKGHYSNMCAQPTLCLFCLSDAHPHEDCPQKNVCYKCYRCGHMISQCQDKDKYLNRCHRCQRNHEGQCYFLTRGKQRTKKMLKLDHLYHNEEIRCGRCGKYGHIQCSSSQLY